MPEAASARSGYRALLLREVAAAARRLMADIHELASAYGWSEAAIVSMSTARRAAYLEMLTV